MLQRLPRLGSIAALALFSIAAPASAQIILGGEPAITTPGAAPVATAELRIDPDAQDIKPVVFAIPDFASAMPEEAELSKKLSALVRADLAGSGLFAATNPAAYSTLPADISVLPAWADWNTTGSQALVVGKLTLDPARGVSVQFRAYDVAGRKQLVGQQYSIAADNWAQLAHKIADDIYEKITGAGAMFDSRIAFVSEVGGKAQLGIVNHDGGGIANPLTNVPTIRTPRFSRSALQVIYSADAPVPGKTSTAQLTTILYDMASGRREPLVSAQPQPAPDARFSADGKSVVYSRKIGGNSEIVVFDIATRKEKVVATSPKSDTAPSLSPDGAKVAFVSDRDGGSHLYVASVDGSDVDCATGGKSPVCRITSGDGGYVTPAWSPAGDFIAFTVKHAPGTAIGTVKPDGADLKPLTSDANDSSPTWSPNGRVIAFTRTAGQGSKLWSIDRSGRNLRQIPTLGDAYEPDWGPLQQ